MAQHHARDERCPCCSQRCWEKGVSRETLNLLGRQALVGLHSPPGASVCENHSLIR